jgi:hypothetical protein
MRALAKRLPAPEARVARGPDGWLYPWGNAFDPTYLI